MIPGHVGTQAPMHGSGQAGQHSVLLSGHACTHVAACAQSACTGKSKEECPKKTFFDRQHCRTHRVVALLLVHGLAVLAGRQLQARRACFDKSMQAQYFTLPPVKAARSKKQYAKRGP